MFKHHSTITEVNLIEQQANNTVDEINKVQEKIKNIMKVSIKLITYY